MSDPVDPAGFSAGSLGLWLGRGTEAAHPIFAARLWDSPWHRVTGVLVSKNKGDPSAPAWRRFENCEDAGRRRCAVAELPLEPNRLTGGLTPSAGHETWKRKLIGMAGPLIHALPRKRRWVSFCVVTPTR